MKRAITAQEMRDVDSAAAAVHGLPAGVLMENAGEALAEDALRMAGPHGRFLVICGSGNNGGDGLVAARRLVNAGRHVHVELMTHPDKLEGEPKRNLLALRGAGISPAPISPDLQVGPGDVVIDALFGTGLNRAPEGTSADAIGRMSEWKAAGAKLLAADLPSGLHSDTGQPFAPCIRADATTSFGALKVVQVMEPGASICGELHLADIGLPPATIQGLKGSPVFLLEESDAKARVPARKADSHKGTYGHVLVVAGSWGKTGAAALAGMGALRAGAGLVTVATRPEALVPVLAHAPELMGVELVSDGGLGLGDLNSLLEAADGKQALVLGPGIPRGEETGKLIGALLEEVEIPCLLDADALNAISGNLGVLEKAKGPIMLTPHPGEMARLQDKTVVEVQASRILSTRLLAVAHHLVVVLKGARTVIATEEGRVYINPTGNAGMATGGMGDVLSGICGGLLAQGLNVEDAAVAGVYAHGLAGDLQSAKRGMMGLVATDVLEGLGEVWARWSR
ncbi:MAG TPA: NAD(P)H-hydrate dehydratase [Myxococcaceae bacterium]|nr:NAD(P)H-hydrate dehydratase [Myxococcaceae bacterium]